MSESVDENVGESTNESMIESMSESMNESTNESMSEITPIYSTYLLAQESWRLRVSSRELSNPCLSDAKHVVACPVPGFLDT